VQLSATVAEDLHHPHHSRIVDLDASDQQWSYRTAAARPGDEGDGPPEPQSTFSM